MEFLTTMDPDIMIKSLLGGLFVLGALMFAKAPESRPHSDVPLRIDRGNGHDRELRY